ncbi:MAG: carbohydrate-binding domain-containing protein [Ruminococcus sp.]|nr:carbohydrate-binding domain-containing protein [Ruminococcus sp.]
MKYSKILSAALIALLCSVSCGKEESITVQEVPSSSSQVSRAEEEPTTEEFSETSETTVITSSHETQTSAGTQTTVSLSVSAVSSVSSTALSSVPAVSATVTSSAVTTVSVDTSSSNSANSNSANNSDNTNNADNNSDASQNQQEQETEPIQEESPYTAEIELGGDIKGENVTSDGDRVIISAGGDYLITGSLSDGQVYIDAPTEDKVKIILDSVDISCSYGPAILVNDAKKCTIELADGSYNVLHDGGEDKVNDGVIFSNDTLKFKGEGTLEVNSGNAHGIASDDDVVIESGTYYINSVKSGIFAHDDISINGGELEIKGGTNGIKSKGTVNINGGKTVAYGGTKEEKSSVYAGIALNYTGGELYAAGNKVTAPAVSANPYIVADFKNGLSAGTNVSLYLDGNEISSLTPHNNFRCVIILSSDIQTGSKFIANADGNETEEFTVSDIQNVFTIE